MPAGVLKTPSNDKAKETVQKSAERTTSNGKKLVQTRLPFKMITPSGAPSAAASTTSVVEAGAVVNLDEDDPPAAREPRKRKLSYDDETPPSLDGTGCSAEIGLLRRSNSKENLDLSGAIATKKVKTTDEEEAQVIELNDDDEEEKDREAVVKVVAALPTKPKATKEKSSSAPIQIKWPLANNRSKRKKSLKKADKITVDALPKDGGKVGSESSDDIEALAVELNPQKKTKVLKPEKSSNQPNDDQKKTEEQMVQVLVDKPQEESTPIVETPKQEKIAEKKVIPEADISVILSSSEGDDSSSEREMDVDTEAADKADAPLRMSHPESKANDARKALTPKQQRLLDSRRKAREEKEQKLAEERRLKQLEKEEKEQQKKIERELKEQQRKLEREEKEQQKKVEREEKERKRQAEADCKNEEKRKRNEAKEEVQRKKDEDRRKKELQREEAEQNKKRAAESFTKFFVPKQPKSGGSSNATNAYLEHEQSSCDSTKNGSSSQTLAFRPFQVKDDMLLAPITRASLSHDQRSQLDGLFRQREEQNAEEEAQDDAEEDIGRKKRPNRAHLYLSELSSGRHKPLRMLRDARLLKHTKDEEDDEVQIIDDLSTAGLPIEEEPPKQLARMRAKYLHFAFNRRPPYYGTWRKKSQTISARRPWAQDKAHFDYELDSECEWEEEEPGESLSASEDEKDGRESEEESEEEEYNEWYVPHGHLSDEELQNDGDDDGNTREAQLAKLKVLQQEFAQEMKKQTKKIKPRILGPVWLDENGNQSDQLPPIFAQTIGLYAYLSKEKSISLEPPPEPKRDEPTPEQVLPLQLDERLLQQLVRLTHGNRNSKVFLINEYLEYLKTQTTETRKLLPSKTLIREKFDELASWKPVELTGTPEVAAKKSKKPKKRLCWIVSSEMLAKFHLTELTLQNQWEYTLTPKVSGATGGVGEKGEGGGAGAEPQHELSPPADAESVAATATASTPVVDPQLPATISATPTTPIGPGKTAGVIKKRATLLMSVPRDQPVPVAAKNALIFQFLRRQTDAKENKQKPTPVVDEDVVMLSD